MWCFSNSNQNYAFGAMVTSKTNGKKTKKKTSQRISNSDKEEKRQQNIRDAIDFKKNNSTISVRAVARRFQIPKSTLPRFIDNPGKIGRGRCGLPVLGVDNEILLKEWIFEMVDRGFSVCQVLVLQKAN